MKEPENVWIIRKIDNIGIIQDGDEIHLLIKNKDDHMKIILGGYAIKNYNDTFVIAHKMDMDKDTDEVAKLRRENEDLKKVLWAVADKVKDFKKEDKQ